MALKNIDFNKDRDYIESDVVDEYTEARSAGIRRAQSASAPAQKADLIPIRRQPVRVPRDQNGDVDYKNLDRPAYQRRATSAPETNAPALPVRAPADEPVHVLPNVDRQNGVRINMSDMLSGFISKMRMTPNEKLGCVDFSMPDESKVAFRRFPDAITVGDRAPDDSIILVMLELGKSDFGAIEVYGSPEFIAAAVRVAIESGIVLQNREYTQALSAPRARMKG